MTTPTDGTLLLLDEQQVAHQWGLSVRALQNWRYRGGGPPFVRISRNCVRYSVQALEKWISERVATSTSEITEAEARANY